MTIIYLQKVYGLINTNYSKQNISKHSDIYPSVMLCACVHSAVCTQTFTFTANFMFTPTVSDRNTVLLIRFFTVCNFCCQSKPNITSKRLISWLPQTEKNSLYTSILISFQFFIKQFDKNQSIHHHIQLLPQWVRVILIKHFCGEIWRSLQHVEDAAQTAHMVQYNLIQSNHSSYGIGACTVKHTHTISVHLAGMYLVSRSIQVKMLPLQAVKSQHFSIHTHTHILVTK